MRKISILINEEFDSNIVYGNSNKYIKTKIKIDNNGINISFHDRKVPKEDISCKCL